MAKIFDCFTFYNELDLLEIRLRELDPVVDHFVLVESTVTHRGQAKPLYYAQNRDRYAAFADKIIHVVMDDVPPLAPGEKLGNDVWTLENRQRRWISRGLDAAAPDDVVIISDLDEIPRAACVAGIKDVIRQNDVYVFEVDTFYQYLDLFRFAGWLGPRAILNGSLRDPQLMRKMNRIKKMKWMRDIARVFYRTLGIYSKIGDHYNRIFLPNAGWHFSFMGSAAIVHEKMQGRVEALSGVDDAAAPDEVRDAISRRMGAASRSVTQVSLDALPACIGADREMFAHLLRPADESCAPGGAGL